MRGIDAGYWRELEGTGCELLEVGDKGTEVRALCPNLWDEDESIGFQFNERNGFLYYRLRWCFLASWGVKQNLRPTKSTFQRKKEERATGLPKRKARVEEK